MRDRAKTFDCIEHKRRVQRELMAEYEARKDEFPSLVAFLKAKAEESEWVRRMREKFGLRGKE